MLFIIYKFTTKMSNLAQHNKICYPARHRLAAHSDALWMGSMLRCGLSTKHTSCSLLNSTKWSSKRRWSPCTIASPPLVSCFQLLKYETSRLVIISPCPRFRAAGTPDIDALNQRPRVLCHHATHEWREWLIGGTLCCGLHLQWRLKGSEAQLGHCN